MKERSRFMDDLAGVAQGAMSAFTGLKDEAEAVFAARVEAVIQKLDLARGEQLAAVQDLAANARMAQEAADQEIAALRARITALEAAAMAGKPAERPAGAPLTDLPQDVPPLQVQDPDLGMPGGGVSAEAGEGPTG